MPYKDRAKQAEYQRKRLLARRLAWVEEHGPCVDCGGATDLEIDHVDPETKAVNVAQLWSRRKEVLEAELAKCVVRCRACHLEKTKRELSVDYPHGHRYRYDKGCRCALCREACRIEQQEYRAKRKALDPFYRRVSSKKDSPRTA